HARRLTVNKYDDVLDGDIRVFNAEGQLVADVRGFRVQRRKGETSDGVDAWLYETRWESEKELDRSVGRPLPDDLRGSWLILAGRAKLGPQLAALVEAYGLPCTLAFAGQSYERIGPRQYQVNPSCRDDFGRMLNEG